MKKILLALVVTVSSLLCHSQTTFTGVKDIPLPVALPTSEMSAKAFQPNSLIGCYATSEARTAARNAWLAEKSIVIITEETNWTNSNPNNNNQFCINISGNNSMGTPLEPLNKEEDAAYFTYYALIGCYGTAAARTAAVNSWLMSHAIYMVIEETNWENPSGPMGSQFCTDTSGYGGF